MSKKVLTIERSKWRRGGINQDSVEWGGTQLRNSKGFMCCLGFAAVAWGIPEEAITFVHDPATLATTFKDVPEDYLKAHCVPDTENVVRKWNNNDWTKNAMYVNDAGDFTDEDRENDIRFNLLQLGWDDIVFVD